MKGPELISNVLGGAKHKFETRLQTVRSFFILPNLRQIPQPHRNNSFETELLEPLAPMETNEIRGGTIVFIGLENFTPSPSNINLN